MLVLRKKKNGEPLFLWAFIVGLTHEKKKSPYLSLNSRFKYVKSYKIHVKWILII